MSTAVAMNVTKEQTNSGRLSESHVVPTVFSRSVLCYFFTMNACTVVGLSSVGLKNLNFGLVQVFKSFFQNLKTLRFLKPFFSSAQ